MIGNIGRPEIQAVVPKICDKVSFKNYLEGFATFGDMLFSTPVPFERQLQWHLVSMGVSPTIIGLNLTRKQDPQNMWEAGKNGLKLLCLDGDQDQQVKGNSVFEFMSKHFVNIEHVTIHGANHAFFVDKPEESARAILDFVQRSYS
jgi:pimeloyl-ACP methyl ester carboxylesterase